MGIVTAQEVANVMNLKKLGPIGTAIGWIVLRTTKLSILNKEYDSRKDLEGKDFINSFLA